MRERQLHTDEEALRKSAPILFSIDKSSSPFILPESYFEQFPLRINSLVLLSKKRDFEAPQNYFSDLPEKLKVITLQKKSSFEAPEGYFDKLPGVLQEQVHRDKPSLRRSLFPRLAVSMLAAAAVILVVTTGINFYFIKDSNNNETALNLKQINVEDAESILLESADENFLLEHALVSAEPIDNREAISDYLIENQIDVNTLATEL
jgi:hypothetical protein